MLTANSMTRTVRALSLIAAALASSGCRTPGRFETSREQAIRQPTLASWSDRTRLPYLAREQRLINSATRDSLLRTHQLLADEPHVAGTPGDWRTIEEIAAEFRAMGVDADGKPLKGWTVEIEEFWPLLSRPIAAAVEIMPDTAGASPLSLELRERPLSIDPASQSTDPLATLAWNAYSGSGDVTAGVVYANYGTKRDFERLKELGIDCTGKIVIARYGGNYRGYKPKYAEEAGAAGLIIYTDPADSGYTKGPVYSEGSVDGQPSGVGSQTGGQVEGQVGGWASDCCIQRGSIVTLGYQGDPLTPGSFASENATRLPVDAVALPRIPVQPMGYGAAQEILKRMTGTPVPEEWRGGLPFEYRLTGGDDLRVRLMVKQEREVRRTANVIARLEGSGTVPERRQHVIIGCHHDAWYNGAADPTCGTIAMMESARAFTRAVADGDRPLRSVVFAAWGAEEFGIIGSSEFVERRRDDLTRNCIGYINLDMASMGPNFGASASPELKTLIRDCSRVVPAARDNGRSVFVAWRERAQPSSPDAPPITEPPVGDLGGGSDHVPFLMHAGVPSASVGGSGSAGNSYHSVYDSLVWYWRVVGDDYEPALMVTRMATAVASRLANAPVVPHDRALSFAELRLHARAIDRMAVERGLAPAPPTDTAWAVPALETLDEACARMQERATMGRAASGRWLVNEGLPGRPWYRNAFIATDETSGYANWLLPALRKAIEEGDRAALDAAADQLTDLVRRQ